MKRTTTRSRRRCARRRQLERPRSAPPPSREKLDALGERIVALIKQKGPLKSRDIVAAFSDRPAKTVTAKLSNLLERGALEKADKYGAPYALAKGGR